MEIEANNPDIAAEAKRVQEKLPGLVESVKAAPKSTDSIKWVYVETPSREYAERLAQQLAPRLREYLATLGLFRPQWDRVREWFVAGEVNGPWTNTVPGRVVLTLWALPRH